MTIAHILRAVASPVMRLRGADGGQVLVVFALGTVAFGGMVGMTVDVGRLVFAKVDLQKLADAAALAGAQPRRRQHRDRSARFLGRRVHANRKRPC